MDLVIGIDTETTGLEPGEDKVTEFAWVLKRWRDPKPLVRKVFYLYDEGTYGDEPVSKEIYALTKITNDVLKTYGRHPRDVYREFLADVLKYQPNYLLAHNASFDQPMVEAGMKEWGVTVPDWNKAWLCSKADIPWETRSTHLNYLAAEEGFLNPFPHDALSDVMTMFRVAESQDLDDIVAYRDMPEIIIRAMVSFDERDLAKRRRYRWQEPGNGRTFDKKWVKIIKESALEQERAEAPFDVIALT